jgi:hypothetical protein
MKIDTSQRKTFWEVIAWLWLTGIVLLIGLWKWLSRDKTPR